MNWDEVSAIGQVLGSIAVFITLVYLSVQTRHARSESRRTLSQGRAEAIRDINSLFVDERVASVWTKTTTALEMPISPPEAALMERAKLTLQEAFLVGIVSRILWRNTVQTIPNVDELTAIERREFENIIRSTYGTNGPIRIFYEFDKTSAHPDAVRYVESVLAQAVHS